MIHAYISIGLKSGMKVQYVRDVTTDTLGEGGKFYGYRGPGYQDLGVSTRRVAPMSKLLEETQYFFRLAVDGGAAQEYSVTTPKVRTEKFFIQENKNVVLLYDTINLLNQVTKKDGAIWEVGKTGDIRCISTSKEAGTSIALSAGVSGPDLFAALGADLQTPVAGDQLADQTGAGKVLGDFTTLTHGLGQIIKEKVSYIAGTPQDIYTGDLKEFLTSFDTHELKVYVNGLLQKVSEFLEEGVEDVGGTNDTIQPDGLTYDSSYETNFVVFTSGENEGEIRQISGGADGVFNLDVALPENVAIGDTYDIYTSYDYLVLENGVLFVEDLTAGDYVFIQQNDTLDGAFVFPESTGNTNILRRKNNNESDRDGGLIVTQIPVNAVTELAIIEKTM